jgi:hypothetical protein
MVCCEKVDALLNLGDHLNQFFCLVHDGSTLKLLRTLFLVLVMLLMSLNLIDYICEHRLLVKDYKTCLLEVFRTSENLTLALLHVLDCLQVFESQLLVLLQQSTKLADHLLQTRWFNGHFNYLLFNFSCLRLRLARCEKC